MVDNAIIGLLEGLTQGIEQDQCRPNDEHKSSNIGGSLAFRSLGPRPMA